MMVSPSATSAASTSDAEARRSEACTAAALSGVLPWTIARLPSILIFAPMRTSSSARSEEHTSELQSRLHLVCRLLLEKKQDGSELQSRLQLVWRLVLEKTKDQATGASSIAS